MGELSSNPQFSRYILAGDRSCWICTSAHPDNNLTGVKMSAKIFFGGDFKKLCFRLGGRMAPNEARN